MGEFIIEKDFLVSYPVYALPQNSRFSFEQAKLCFDDFIRISVPSGNALALYTDCDLAQRFLAGEGVLTGVVLAKLLDCEALVTVLEIAKARGSDRVIFDASQRGKNNTTHCYCIDAVIESAKKGRAESCK